MTRQAPVALITGAAHRLGAHTARHLHGRGWNLVIHYRSRDADARALANALNAARPESATTLQADLSDHNQIKPLAESAIAAFGRLDGLVNNASVFYPCATEQANLDDWDTVMHTNLRAPFFLGQACLPSLRQSKGAIVNLIDIYSEHPLADHPLYCASKSGLASLTRTWAKDLAPDIRVNGVSPGAILWPEGDAELPKSQQQAILDKTPLQRTGKPEDIAGAIAFLLCDAPFVTGQILPVDGGRSLNI